MPGDRNLVTTTPQSGPSEAHPGQTFDVPLSVGVAVRTLSADSVWLDSDGLVMLDLTTAAFTLTLLPPSTTRRLMGVVVIGTSDVNQCTLTTPSGVIGVGMAGAAATWPIKGRGSALLFAPTGTDYAVFAIT